MCHMQTALTIHAYYKYKGTQILHGAAFTSSIEGDGPTLAQRHAILLQNKMHKVRAVQSLEPRRDTETLVLCFRCLAASLPFLASPCRSISSHPFPSIYPGPGRGVCPSKPTKYQHEQININIINMNVIEPREG